MDQSPALSIGLPIAIGIVMLGLGLSLTRADFTRVREAPRAVIVALGLQMLFLPLLAYGLILLFDLAPLLAVGVMLLAASPGGTTAGMFSYLFRGDVALNVTLTAVNSVLTIVTLPLITGWAVSHFNADSEGVGVQLGKFGGVVVLVLMPVAIGMWLRSVRPQIAERAERPIKAFAIVFLVVVVLLKAPQARRTQLAIQLDKQLWPCSGAQSNTASQELITLCKERAVHFHQGFRLDLRIQVLSVHIVVCPLLTDLAIHRLFESRMDLTSPVQHYVGVKTQLVQDHIHVV